MLKVHIGMKLLLSKEPHQNKKKIPKAHFYLCALYRKYIFHEKLNLELRKSGLQLQPDSRLLTFLPEQHELQHMLQLLHKLPDPGLRVVAQLLGPTTSSVSSVSAGARGSGPQVSVSHSTSVSSSWESHGLAAGRPGSGGHRGHPE